MVVDIGIVKNHIKPKADSTLRNMRKDDLIEYIRCLENNYNVAVSFNNQQAKYIESLGITEVVLCKDCVHCDHYIESAMPVDEDMALAFLAGAAAIEHSTRCNGLFYAGGSDQRAIPFADAARGLRRAGEKYLKRG